MPWKPKTPCMHQGCGMLCSSRYCEEHQKLQQQKQRMYNRQWQKARRLYLREFPLCVMCAKEGRVTPATEVDHIRPHDGDRLLFWDRSNWQPMCRSCHSRKTAVEGGWAGR